MKATLIVLLLGPATAYAGGLSLDPVRALDAQLSTPGNPTMFGAGPRLTLPGNYRGLIVGGYRIGNPPHASRSVQHASHPSGHVAGGHAPSGGAGGKFDVKEYGPMPREPRAAHDQRVTRMLRLED